MLLLLLVTSATAWAAAPTAAANVNGDTTVDIVDIAKLIDIFVNGGLIKRVVSNVELVIGH